MGSIVRVHRDALCKSVELRKLSRLAKYRCTKRGVPSLTSILCRGTGMRRRDWNI
jgi:hypothetical protein